MLISRWTLRKSFGGGVDVDIYVGEWGVNEEDGMTRDSRGWGGGVEVSHKVS